MSMGDYSFVFRRAGDKHFMGDLLTLLLRQLLSRMLFLDKCLSRLSAYCNRSRMLSASSSIFTISRLALPNVISGDMHEALLEDNSYRNIVVI
jgi:hypothetical protein